MIDIHSLKRVHFTGIKGVGMTALACIFQDCGCSVTGSDTSESFITDKILGEKGIRIENSFLPETIAAVKPDLVIFTAAHGGETNGEVQVAKSLGIPVLSQGEALGLFQKTKTGISIAGVGGKTTTTAMLATILDSAGMHPSYMIGVGEVPSLNAPGRYDHAGNVFVTEADEYACSPQNTRPKFYYQTPKVIVLTNVAFDHPDIYDSPEETLKTFEAFIKKLPDDGLLIANNDNPLSQLLLERTTCNRLTYGASESADWMINRYTVFDEQAHFGIANGQKERVFRLNVPGRVNAYNATAAALAAEFLGLSDEDIQKGLLAFTGTKRRFEKITQINSTYLYDDYAHHPDEVKATIESAQNWFADKRIIIIFQPHTYSRTKALFSQFATSLDLADTVILTDIYASAREKSDPTVSSQQLAETIAKEHDHVYYCAGEGEVTKRLFSENLTDTVIITMGAGNVYTWHEEIIKTINAFYVQSGFSQPHP